MELFPTSLPGPELWPATADIHTVFDGIAFSSKFEAVSSYARSNGVQVGEGCFEDVSLDSVPGFVSKFIDRNRMLRVLI